jgi:hypothetical protein
VIGSSAANADEDTARATVARMKERKHYSMDRRAGTMQIGGLEIAAIPITQTMLVNKRGKLASMITRESSACRADRHRDSSPIHRRALKMPVAKAGLF